MPQPIISVYNFSKSFGNQEVISNLSFSVNKGEIFAFLGANGSGKTTTIRCLLGIYQPTAGELLINGQKYTSDMASFLGYLPEERGLYTTSRVLETMLYFGQLKGMSASAAKKWSLEYLETVDLAHATDTEIKKLSSGQQQKVQLGITIINQPELLILDEPTKGLDPVNRDLLMSMLFDLNEKGSTVIFSTHQMEEAEKIADRLLMIKNGRKELYGSLTDVKQQFGSSTVHLEFSGELPANPKLFTAHVSRQQASLTPKGKNTPHDILQFLAKKKVQVREFKVDTPSLHEIFVQVSQQDKVTRNVNE